MGILLVFGSAVYVLVSILLITHIDNLLATTVNDIVSVTRVNLGGGHQCDQVSSIEHDCQRLRANLGTKWEADDLLAKSFPTQ